MVERDFISANILAIHHQLGPKVLPCFFSLDMCCPRRESGKETQWSQTLKNWRRWTHLFLTLSCVFVCCGQDTLVLANIIADGEPKASFLTSLSLSPSHCTMNIQWPPCVLPARACPQTILYTEMLRRRSASLPSWVKFICLAGDSSLCDMDVMSTGASLAFCSFDLPLLILPRPCSSSQFFLF